MARWKMISAERERFRFIITRCERAAAGCHQHQVLAVSDRVKGQDGTEARRDSAARRRRRRRPRRRRRRRRRRATCAVAAGRRRRRRQGGGLVAAQPSPRVGTTNVIDGARNAAVSIGTQNDRSAMRRDLCGDVTDDFRADSAHY